MGGVQVACRGVKISLHTYEKAMDAPLTIAALAFFVAFALPIVWYPGMPQGVTLACTITLEVTWAVFVVDFVIRMLLVHDRRAYLRRRWFDLLVIVMPMLRPLQLLPLLSFFNAVNRRASARLRGRVLAYAAGGAIAVATIGSLAVLQAERGHRDANITDVGTAFWWSAETMTSVGYGDVYPVSPLGRAIAVALMISGIAVLSAVTAGLASWIVEPVKRAAGGGAGVDLEAEVGGLVGSAVHDEVESLRAEIDRLRTALDARPANPADPAPGTP